MTLVVLDASALLALLLNEPGGQRVKQVLSRSAISTVNLGEVVAHFARHGASEPDIRAVLDPLPLDRRLFDEEQAYSAGLLLVATRAAGLSFGDRACLALAKSLNVKALTADRVWSRVASTVDVEVEVIRPTE
ncbi:PIN domain-containing protein [Indioceanicola profundi]|uniref:PIN domain-containing protein n=1 Tax=Indioceanicola profundi TaxID=2220096 RepID=UPI000E6AA3F3|nr:type II toxin-antitoxin system VapC family toxin [Indioceanicola profundi]